MTTQPTDTPAPPTVTATTTTAPTQEQDDDPAALRRELREARAEAARYRTQARDAAQQSTTAQTDAEKAAQALADRERALNEREVKAVERENVSTVAAAASALGFRDPRDAYALIREDLDRNDDGTIKNPDRALRDLLRDKPYLGTGAGGADAGQGRGAGAPIGRTFNDAIRTAAGKQ